MAQPQSIFAIFIKKRNPQALVKGLLYVECIGTGNTKFLQGRPSLRPPLLVKIRLNNLRTKL